MMGLLRGVAAVLVFLAGLITFASALYILVVTVAAAEETHQPIDVASLVGGLIAGIVGILCLLISRSIDPEGGPVLKYRKFPDRPRKPRRHM